MRGGKKPPSFIDSDCQALLAVNLMYLHEATYKNPTAKFTAEFYRCSK
jgi:hypothetical protein